MQQIILTAITMMLLLQTAFVVADSFEKNSPSSSKAAGPSAYVEEKTNATDPHGDADRKLAKNSGLQKDDSWSDLWE